MSTQTASQALNHNIKCNHSAFMKSLKALLEYSPKSDIRYYLNGVLFEFDVYEKCINLVATDGHRLLYIPMPCEFVPDELHNIQYIADRESIEQLVKIVKARTKKGIDPEITITTPLIGEKFITISTYEDVSFSLKLVDGRFPDYRRVMPKQGETKETNEIGFNAEYIGALSKLAPLLGNTKSLKMELFGPSSATLVIGFMPDINQYFKAVIMPCRI